jgi:DNA-directed RNA polymerase II subunit RPB1
MQESTILGIQFGIFSPEEIRKSSVAEITRRDTYVNNKAVVGGMFDTRMGILEPGLICPTDGLDYIQCPGYFGHIELAKPVFYIQYLDTVVNIAQCICIKCSKLLINKEKYSSFLSLPSDKRWKQVHALCHKITRCGESSEMGCGCKQPTKYKQEGFSTIIAEWKVPDTPPISLKVTPEMFIKIFRRISDDDISFMGFSPLWSRPEWMICQVLAVPPPSVRPSVKYDSAQRSEDDLTYILVQIIKANETLKGKIALDASPSTIDDYHSVLQFFIATLVDNKIPNAKPAAQRSGRAFKSIKDRLNGKTGRVRGNLMGKRVDFSARSVITPDPNLSIRELGVPIKIAQNITKPVTVNSRNIHSLNALVKNGPDVYPGAKLLERTINGKTIHISLKYADRESIQLNEGDIVHRHMMDGDVILFNRQPTLHRMSMM